MTRVQFNIISKLLDVFEEAVRSDEMKGSQPLEDRLRAEQNYETVKHGLKMYLFKLIDYENDKVPLRTRHSRRRPGLRTV